MCRTSSITSPSPFRTVPPGPWSASGTVKTQAPSTASTWSHAMPRVDRRARAPDRRMEQDAVALVAIPVEIAAPRALVRLGDAHAHVGVRDRDVAGRETEVAAGVQRAVEDLRDVIVEVPVAVAVEAAFFGLGREEGDASAGHGAVRGRHLRLRHELAGARVEGAQHRVERVAVAVLARRRRAHGEHLEGAREFERLELRRKWPCSSCSPRSLCSPCSS